MARLEVNFDNLDKMANWLTRAITRGLLPQDATAIEIDPTPTAETYMVTDTRQAAGLTTKELPFERPDPMEQTDVQDRRQALTWLVMGLLQETDTRLALTNDGFDPDTIELSGSDVVVATKSGVRYMIQALPLTSPTG